MSTPTQPPGDEPRYGRRSAHWRPDGGDGRAGGAQPSPESPAGEEESPWPRYGQTSGGTGREDQGEATPWPRYGEQPSPDRPPYAGPAPSARNRSALPGRAGPILLILAGIVTMLVAAPLVLTLVVASALGRDATASAQVSNGSQVSVDQSGELSVYAGSGEDPGCVLTRSGAQDVTLRPDPDIPQMVSAQGVDPGAYTLRCSALSEGQTLVAFSGSDMRELWSAAPRAFGAATVVGLLGFAGLIAGIVWLTRRNRERRRLAGVIS